MTDERLIAHLTWCRGKGLRPSTIEQRKRHIERFVRRIGISPLDATVEQTEHWWLTLTCGPVSRGVELSHIRSYTLWGVRFGHITQDPTARLDAPRRRRRLPRPIGADRLEQALANSRTTPRLYVCLTLAAYSGLRCIEIATLRWPDVDNEKMIVTGKGGHQRTVPLHPMVSEALSMLPPDDSIYVISRFDGWKDRHLAPGRVSSMINEYLHSQGIPDTAHSLRHRFGTEFYRASKDIRLTQDILGHSSPITTALYAQSDVDTAASFMAAI